MHLGLVHDINNGWVTFQSSTTLWANSAEDKLIILLSYFTKKNRISHSCKLFPSVCVNFKSCFWR